MKRIKDNISKLLATLTEEFPPHNTSKCEKLEISSEDTLEEPLDDRLFTPLVRGKKQINENLFDEELKADEEDLY